MIYHRVCKWTVIKVVQWKACGGTSEFSIGGYIHIPTYVCTNVCVSVKTAIQFSLMVIMATNNRN